MYSPFVSVLAGFRMDIWGYFSNATASLRSYLLDLVSPAESAFPVVTPFTGEVPPFACAFSRGRRAHARRGQQRAHQ